MHIHKGKLAFLRLQLYHMGDTCNGKKDFGVWVVENSSIQTSAEGLFLHYKILQCCASCLRSDGGFIHPICPSSML